MPVMESPTRPLLDDQATATMLNVSPQTLANWRVNRRVDLPFVKLGRAVRYRPEDVERFISLNTTGGDQPQDD